MLQHNLAGYNMIEGQNNVWYLQVVDRIAFTGTLKEVVKFAIIRLGFNFHDLHEAILFLGANGYNAAHFGMHKRFIYTFNQDLTTIKKAN